MKNYKYEQQTKLECKECVCLVKSKITCLKERMKESKRICNCHCLIHKERCPLSPCIYNERRWPGSDICPRTRKQYISAEDRAFLDGLNPKPAWWKKAWGKEWAVQASRLIRYALPVFLTLLIRYAPNYNWCHGSLWYGMPQLWWHWRFSQSMQYLYLQSTIGAIDLSFSQSMQYL